MAAVLNGKTEIVKILLDNGADPTIPEAQGYLPPHGAAFQGRAEVMQVLIDAGIDVNSTHTDGFLPLHRACFGGRLVSLFLNISSFQKSLMDYHPIKV